MTGSTTTCTNDEPMEERMETSDQTVRTEGGALVLSRSFAAPRDRVFAAYTSCAHLKHWWGPRSWPMVECSMDFRVGGVWHYCLRGPNEGDASWGRAVFEEIAQPERIVYVDAFSDAEGTVNDAMPQTRSTVEFEAVGGTTRVTMRAEYPSADDLRTVLDMGMVAGITETMDRLDEHLADEVKRGA